VPRGDQQTRHWRLLRLLHDRPGHALADLAERLGVTTRTIRRDLEVLERSGYPIYDDETGDGGKVWKLMENYSNLPRVAFTLDETLALFVVRHLLKQIKNTPFEASYESALAKIEATYSGEQAGMVHKLAGAFVSTPGVGRDFAGESGFIELLTRAITKRLRVDVTYYSAGRDRMTLRRIDPYHLWWANRNLYLLAWCHKAKGMRTFLLDRFESIEMLNESFEIPGGFDPDEYVKDAFGAYISDPVDVELEFDTDDAGYFEARVFHGSQKVRLSGDGKVVVTMHVGIGPELVTWVTGMGAWVRVLHPAGLRERVRKAHEIALGIHSEKN